MAKYVVTGSSGRIGRAIHFTLSRNHEVVGVDVTPASSTTLISDICDEDQLKRAFHGADAVFHCAALHAPHVGLKSDEEFQRINVRGTECVIDGAKAEGVPQIIFTSTTALYGDASNLENRAAWITEETEPHPRTIYHRSKIHAEALLRDAASSQLNIKVIRMSRSFPEPAPVMATYRLHRGVDARDVADAHLAALKDTGRAFDTYVISGQTPFLADDAHALKTDAASVIRERAPSLAKLFDLHNWALPTSIDRVYAPTKAAKVLSWKSKYDFREVLHQLEKCNSEVLPPDACGSKVEE
ncbi:dTDP-glucose 4,6-dehydratase [Pseudovibrio axinellae]|uniref:dTDP-glucose 4,6-dehydratase n=1 Tax=Pseudovibrio axinellae TaxID=989403 RepID=A0A165UJK7_9HYPH|nr:NAD(P)-dependent oxidoreductase [Pseudovibrio axinellae]KZL11589.1 dTDP-glucose 4,6-dehydratase [Pseudovibrio axinellae]SER88575.1 Nucleoside-diphosphate-sugar epimerase [Pseudovibrio axinellae]